MVVSSPYLTKSIRRFVRNLWQCTVIRDIGHKALWTITFGTYGSFGKSTHKLIAAATANAPPALFSPWVKPGPKSHAYLLFGFTLARANARMLINAEAKRRSARNFARASRPQCISAVAVHG